MEFMINGVIRYNASDGTLFYPTNNVDMITLTRIANDLLLLFVNNNHQLLRRDDILNELWEKRGLNASSNNLNNYVSMLRKALERCGFSEMITTVPRHGFLFEAEVALLPDNQSLHDNNHITGNSGNASQPLSSRTETPHRVCRLLMGKTKVAALTVLSLLFLISPDIYTHLRLTLSRTAVFSLENCRFYAADEQTPGIWGKDDITIVKSLAAEKKIEL